MTFFALYRWSQLLYSAPKKSRDRIRKTCRINSHSLFYCPLSLAAIIKNSFITGLSSIMHSLCSKLSTRAGNCRHFAGPLKCSITRLDGDVNRFIAFRERNIDRWDHDVNHLKSELADSVYCRPLEPRSCPASSL